MLFSLRISLPDRPGTLGAVASAFGRGGANILTLEVVERGGVAIDNLVVEAPEGMQEAIRLAQESVPGLAIEEIRPVEAFRDVISPLGLAAILAEGLQPAIPLLVERLPEALRADWCVVLCRGADGIQVLASGLGAPSLADIDPPWLPIGRPTRLPPAEWMPASWTIGPGSREGQGKFELAAAPLLDPNTAVLVGRREGPQFRASELEQLGLLARIAAASNAQVTAK